MQYSLSDHVFMAGRRTGKHSLNVAFIEALAKHCSDVFIDAHMHSTALNVDVIDAMRQMHNSMFDAHAEIAYMDIWPKLQEFMRLVYMPIDDCPVSDMTEFRKCEITHGNGCIITNQGNIMVYHVPGAKQPPEVTHRLVRCIIPKAIEFHLSGHLLRYISDSDRTTLGYFNRFKF